MVKENRKEYFFQEIHFKVRVRRCACERMGGIDNSFTSKPFKYQITILRSTKCALHHLIRSGIYASNV